MYYITNQCQKLTIFTMFHILENGGYIKWLYGYLKETQYMGIIFKPYIDQQTKKIINTNISDNWNTDILR